MTPKHSIHLAALLDELTRYIRGYVVLSDAQVCAAALWVAHTHALEASEQTPFLAITSPEKRCGKSRLLDALELVVARAWRTIFPSEAVLFRKIEAVTPTLMLDETDAIFDRSNGSTEPLRALLNAGNRRGTSVPRCVGPTQQLVDFNIFCPKALAGIGELPDTVADRSIPIRLERKRADEAVQRFRRREALEVAEPIAQALASWATDALVDLEAARPDAPRSLDDRAEESWEPLLAIADMARTQWPQRARSAALELSGDGKEDEALGVWLLRDIRELFEDAGADRFASADLATALCLIETSPWGDNRGKELDARGLARRLRPFKIRPRTVRLDDGTTPKGYPLEVFEDAFARYLVVSDRHTATTPMDKGIEADSRTPHVADGNTAQSLYSSQRGGVADKNAENGGGRINGHSPRPGDPGYLEHLYAAFEAGHVTEREWRQLSTLHEALEEAAP
jgi:hypothetical protein